ncbi:deoxyguanosinetriphosphate triphosphohydrolase [Feifania hominis]|uniref:deoxyguanosinetriphosphate triphosphohydrolase n=1 Tax=Feifania hominis TaxID=2763660 RepID=UPI0024B60B1B|nr:deoxyguanosinetriphosphate triphosphohydrolase [Feifania hominis]
MRQQREDLEAQILSPMATLAKNSRGRLVEEPECEIRTAFIRDRDRIIHSKAFRRLKHKTQVFLAPEGDHYRTRLTHTLEVSQIARTIARALSLNEDLTEAAALGHDLGHTPFGHAGEQVLNELTADGFSHCEQSLRIVDRLEKDRRGLNLTFEVRDAILNHAGSGRAETPEGQILKFADRIAYINHDLDDALRAGVLTEDDIPFDVKYTLGRTHSKRINTLIRAVIEESVKTGKIEMTPEIKRVMDDFRSFMFENLYRNSAPKREEGKAKQVVEKLYLHFVADPKSLPEEYLQYIEEDSIERVVCDYIAGMSDRYAISLFEDIFVPKTWR